jgi:F-type H+-transporting ATPase subunit delta
MKGIKAAGRYAQSLLDLAQEQGVLEAVKDDMEMVSLTISQNRDLQLLLQSPIIKVDQKQKVLTSIFGKNAQALTMQFLAMACSKGREYMLPAILEAGIEQYKERKGIVTAEVTSAVALSDDQRKEVSASLAGLGQHIELKEKVDPNILGGLKVRVADRRVDASFRKKLNELKYDIHNS